jgi:hypothetical protein
MKKGHLIAAAISLVMFAWVMRHVGFSAMLVQLKFSPSRYRRDFPERWKKCSRLAE